MFIWILGSKMRKLKMSSHKNTNRSGYMKLFERPIIWIKRKSKTWCLLPAFLYDFKYHNIRDKILWITDVKFRRSSTSSCPVLEKDLALTAVDKNFSNPEHQYFLEKNRGFGGEAPRKFCLQITLLANHILHAKFAYWRDSSE